MLRITAECAIRIGTETGASFALVGTSPHPAQSSDATAERLRQRYNVLLRYQVKCEYFSCDITDENAVRQLIAQVDATLGRVTGLIHVLDAMCQEQQRCDLGNSNG